MEQLQQRLIELEQSIAQANSAQEAYQLLMEKIAVEDRLARIDN